MNNAGDSMDVFPYCSNQSFSDPSNSKYVEPRPVHIQNFKENYSKIAYGNSQVVSWMNNGFVANNEHRHLLRSPSIKSGMSMCSTTSRLSVITDFSDMTAVSSMYSHMMIGENVQTNNIVPEKVDLGRYINKLNVAKSNKEFSEILRKIRNHIRSPESTVTREQFFSLIERIFNQLNGLKDVMYSDDSISTMLSHAFNTLHLSIAHSDERKQIFINYCANHCKKIVIILCKYLRPECYLKSLLSLIDELFHLDEFKHMFSMYPNIIDIFLQVINMGNKAGLRVALTVLKKMFQFPPLKKKFIEKGGAKYILNLLQNENDERMLYFLAEFLSKLLRNTEMVSSFIESNGIEICTTHLSHGSTRLLKVLLDCLVFSCDQLNGNMHLNDCITSVFKLLGSMDNSLVLNAVKFLGNSMAKNPKNKSLLIKLDAPTTLMRVINEALTRKPDDNTEDLVENTLWAISLLINYNAMADESRHAVTKLTSFPTWRTILFHVLKHQPTVAIKRAVIILNLLADREINLFKNFIENEDSIIKIIYQRIMENFLIINGSKSTGKPNYHRLEKDYKTSDEAVKELMMLNARLISLMCKIGHKHGGPEFVNHLSFSMVNFGDIFNFIEMTLFFPLVCSELMKFATVTLRYPHIKQQLSLNSFFCYGLRKCQESKDEEISTNATYLLSLL
uniref:Uncharacterized protein n=1 Tax=Panagrolaimus sp. JU765 TaxID=591449 RepID=A0AC34RPI2_9BILA